MSHSAEDLQKIALETRRDFEAGLIAVEHLVVVFRLHRPDVAALEDEEATRQGVENALRGFPVSACETATAELRHRVGRGEIIVGSYGQDDGGHYDHEQERYVDGYFEYGARPHTFLGMGSTALAPSTIMDITADQFGGPKVYVGNWCNPYSETGGSLSA
jgi:hypothetical protein